MTLYRCNLRRTQEAYLEFEAEDDESAADWWADNAFDQVNDMRIEDDAWDWDENPWLVDEAYSGGEI